MACVTLSPIISFLFPFALTLSRNEIILIFNSTASRNASAFAKPQDLNIYYTLRGNRELFALSVAAIGISAWNLHLFPSCSSNTANRNLFLSHQYYFLRHREVTCMFVRGNIIIFTSAMQWRAKKWFPLARILRIYVQLILRPSA